MTCAPGDLRALHALSDADPPKDRGVYAWWLVERDALDAVPVVFDAGIEAHLLYVGVGPSRASSGATLRSRLRQHLRGNVSASTFRRTLAALLWEQEGWRPAMTASGRLALGDDGEQRLSAWMSDHLRVAWCVDPAPWAVEHRLIDGMRPPLNLDASGHPFRATVAAKRRRFAELARDAA